VSVLGRKLQRELGRVRATLSAILLVVIIGVACFVGLTTVYLNLESSRRAYYGQCRMADFWVGLKKAPLSEVDRLAEMPGVAEVQPRIVFQATIDLEDVARPLLGQVISLPDTGRSGINGIVLQRGSHFTDERLDQVIVNESFARARDIEPGQTIHIILNNRRQALYVVGTALSSEFVYLISPGGLAPDPANFGVFYIKQRFAEEVLDFDGACNEVVGLLTPAARERDALVLDAIEQALEPYGVFLSTPRSEQASHQILTGELAQLRASAVIMPAIFLAVAALVLNILMFRMAEQQRVTIGTLKALGYSNARLLRHYLGYGLVVGVAGGVLGAFTGYWLAQGMIFQYRVYFEFPRLDNEIIPWVYGVSILVSVAFSLLGTVRGVRSIIRLDPAEAMRARPPVTVGAVWMERFRRVWSRLGFRWQMVMRSVWRHKWRTVAGMFAALMGSVMMFTSCYFMHSIIYLIDFQFEKVLRSDYELAFASELDAGALLEARKLPGVDRAEPLLFVACEFVNGHRTKRSAITGVTDAAQLTVPSTEDGRAVPIPDTGLLMSRRLAEQLDLDRGDDVTVVPIKGLREPHRVTVEHIVDGYLAMATYADYGWLNRLVGEEAAVSAVQLETRSGPEPRRRLYRALKAMPAIQGVIDNRETKDKLVDLLLMAFQYSIWILLAMAGAIFFGSILTTSLTSISERRREVATLSVMGFERRQIGGIFLREQMLINVVGALAGLPLGLWLAIWLINYNTRDAYRFPIVASPLSYVITMTLAVVFTIAAHGLVQRAINRLDLQDALNARE
jgi:putative ABC transport system permease protein